MKQPTATAPRRVLVLSDGRPGHFNLSEGVAAAIERLGEASATRFEVRRGRWPGAVLATLTRARLPARALLAAVYGIDEATVPPCDVIVSAGAETLAANVWLARARAVPNVFYGSLRLFDPRDFALVLTSYARNAGKPRHAMALKPSRLDPDTIDMGIRGATDGGSARTIALLIGGDAGAIRFSSADWEQLTSLVTDAARTHHVRWLVANSRRTPDDVSDRLGMLAARADAPISTFLDVRSSGPGTLPALLAASDAAVCTADSSSMISECVWSRRPTIALAPALCPFTPDEGSYRTWLAESGWCRQMQIAGLTPAALEAGLRGLQPLRQNPLTELANLIVERIPALRGPDCSNPRSNASQSASR